MRKLAFFLIPLLLANLFCTLGVPQPTPPATPTVDLSGMVNATLTAVAASQPSPAPTPTSTPTTAPTLQTTGTILGDQLMYPADRLPGLRIVFFTLDKIPAASMDTAPGQNSYAMDLPAGTYYVVAYSLGGNGFSAGVAGGYTNAVACGLSATCTDHNLIPVTLKPGEKVTGINPNDYYASDGAFPPMPQ